MCRPGSSTARVPARLASWDAASDGAAFAEAAVLAAGLPRPLQTAEVPLPGRSGSSVVRLVLDPAAAPDPETPAFERAGFGPPGRRQAAARTVSRRAVPDRLGE